MKKKNLILVLVIMLVLITGCGAPNANPTSSSTENNGDKKELTVWHIETAVAEVALDEAIQRFEEEHPDVKVNLVRQENDPYKTKLAVAMGGGNPPDVFHSWGGGWLKKFVDAGQVKEITGEVDPDHYLEAALAPSIYDEKIYGVPLSIAFVPVWYNKEIFEKYDLEEPETYEELLGIVETLTANDVIPFALANQSKWPGSFYMMYLAERIGGPDLFNEAFERSGRGFDDEAYLEAAKKIQELVKMNAFPEGVNGMNYDTGQSRQLLYTNKAAMEVMGTWTIGTIREELPEFEEKLGFFMFPSLSGGEGTRKHLVGGVSPVFSVAEKSPNQELAVELVKELTSVETAEKFANTDGSIAAVKGVKYEDDYVKGISDLLAKSEYLQPYYDQTLPPELAEVHLDTTQALFSLSITPEEAVEKVEAKAKELLE
ncbi:extracellular solute-binding protein [Pseudalkalibacillus hwajinpoensis]|uniref:extracellular solute-binding protein n=1 Tax=Guptibacillus hwajinpoensis TaxID=208199 RepID=UPI00325AF503